jgi:hypothetical protein
MSDIELQRIVCYNCGIDFALPKFIVPIWTENKRPFFCPNGCKSIFQKSDMDREAKVKSLEAELSKERTLIKELQATIASDKAVENFK